MELNQEERTELSIRCQLILSTGPTVHDEEAAWDYVRHMAAAMRSGREGLGNLLTLEQLGELWRLKHQREREVNRMRAALGRIGRRLHHKGRRFAALAESMKAGRSA